MDEKINQVAGLICATKLTFEQTVELLRDLMETPEFKKQFRATIFDEKILITTQNNNKEAFEAKIKAKHEIKIGWHDWIETEENSLNYYECCGILLLFGVNPPEYKELFTLLA